MIKRHQTVFEAGKGNALQACVASIFDLEMEQVPNFITAPSYANAIADFVQQHFGLTFLKIKLNNGELDFETSHAPLVLAAGKSPRGNFKHVIVGRIVGKTIELAHDPYLNGQGIDGEVDWVGVFVIV